MAARHLFTSESVTEGHPDKIADQISDAVLDALIAQDPMSRVACEVMVTTGMAFVAGGVFHPGYVGHPNLVRPGLGGNAYRRPGVGFANRTLAAANAMSGAT